MIYFFLDEKDKNFQSVIISSLKNFLYLEKYMINSDLSSKYFILKNIKMIL